ncbi:MAG: flagellar hook-length control protein FliK [Rhizobiales bacterium]|nr:flagellar hook-length control protein FliK [Hyphomicrobiales bacterium]
MKLETSGNVIGFPDVAARGQALKRKLGAENAAEQEAKSGFLSMLRSNLEDAEQIVSALEPTEDRPSSESEASRREGMLDFHYFGTLVGAVATKIASVSLTDVPPEGTEIPAVPSLQVIDKARQFLMDDDEIEVEAEGDVKAARPTLPEVLPLPEADEGEPVERPLKILEINLPEQARAESVALKSNSFVVQGETKTIAPRAMGHEKPADAQDVAVPEEDADNTVVQFRSTARSDNKGGSPSFEQGTDGPDDEIEAQPAAQTVQGDIEVFTNRPADKPPAQQIADNIRQAVPVLHAQPAQGGEKAATIRFKLQPENLGEIEVKLKLRGDKLEVGIIMERGDAAGAVRLAQDDLRKGLGEQGLTVELMDISVAARSVRETASTGQSDLMQQGNQSSRQDWQSGSTGGASHGRSGTQSGGQGRAPAGREDGNGNVQRFAEEPAPRSLRSGVFL